jgi:hypothetical protein
VLQILPEKPRDEEYDFSQRYPRRYFPLGVIRLEIDEP